MPATERVAHNEAITATLIQVLSIWPGMLIGFYWPFKREYDPRDLVSLLRQIGKIDRMANDQGAPRGACKQ